MALLSCPVTVQAQGDILYAKNATADNRLKEQRNLLKYITTNLTPPLSDSTEMQWQDAFDAIELTGYRSLWVDGRIRIAVNSIEKRSIPFQRSLLELLYSKYGGAFISQVKRLSDKTTDIKIFAMCAEYILQTNNAQAGEWSFLERLMQLADANKDNGIMQVLLQKQMDILVKAGGGDSLQKNIPLSLQSFLPGEILVISFQRSNRDYPGLVLVRNAKGEFVRDSAGNIFSVPQLARSLSNLPFYLTNGNTPQGLFRMNGFDVSKSAAIGPTTNIQLMMPQETTPQFFLKDSSVKDTVWSEDLYRRLLPEKYRNNIALYQSYYAGKSGRTEIIAHGSTVNPDYYRGQSYYPHTPTQGCLCCREDWSGPGGKRQQSDQQLLVDALRKAGGAGGYLLVVEIDDKKAPVILKDVVPFIEY
jgi:hypothetical protein